MISADMAPADGLLHHIVVVVDEASTTVFLDGSRL